MIMGLCGLACSGKDTFFKFAKEHCLMNGISCNRFAFADELKKEINDSLKAKLNISAFTEDSKEKELIRPLSRIARNEKKENPLMATTGSIK